MQMTEYINKRTAIEALGERPMVWNNDDDYELGCANQWDSDKLAIESISPEDVQIRRHGKWIEGTWKCAKTVLGEYSGCSECGFIIPARISYRYCPDCGAKMKD